MSFLTHFLDTTPHFAHAIEQIERQLKTTKAKNAKRLHQLVQLSYCYAHVQLQKGVAVAEEAIELAETICNKTMKANALCAKAMNEFRIGYISRAHVCAQQALSIFEKINDEEGKCDACFQLGVMPYVSNGPSDTSFYLTKTCKGYAALGNTTGVYLVQIQQTLPLFLSAKFEEGEREIKKIIKVLSFPHQKHLLCFAHMQLAIGMHLKQNILQCMQALLDWQKLAEVNGNFHDYCMTKAMLPDCYRLQKINKRAMEACLESIECCDKLGSIHGHSTVAIVMANICLGQAQYTDAFFYIKKSIAATLEIDDEYKYLMSLNIMGEIYLKSGQVTKARETFQIVQQEAKLKDYRLHLMAAHRHLAELAYQRGEYDQALFEFKILCDNANNSGHWNIQDNGNYAFSIAKASNIAMQKVGLNPEDRNILRHHYLERYLQLAQMQQIEREEAKALNSLGVYYEETNDLNTAIQFHKKYSQLYEKIVTEENTKSMNSLRLKYETEKKEQEIILLKKESEQALLNERFRISRELHDDIGSTLGSISIYSEVAKNRLKKNENAEEAIIKIGNTSRELIDKINDIVWSMNPDNESFEQLKNRVQVFAALILTPHEIFYTINTCGDVEELKLTSQQIKNIYLIYKEAIYNIIKYAKCSKVDIAMVLRTGEFLITIQDNGKGIDVNNFQHVSDSLGGNGIKNMQARAECIHARLNIEAIKNGGTSIGLKLKI